MGLLSNLRARLGTMGINPNISIPPKLTPSLPRGPAIELPKIPRRRIGLPPRNISRIREDVGGIVERSLPVGEPIPFVPPTIQPDPMPTPMPISLPVLGKPIMQQPRPQPIGVPSLMDPRQPQPNLATGIIDPVSQPIQQLPKGPQPIPQVPQPLEKMPLPPKRDDFMSIGGLGGGFSLDDRDAIDSGVPTQTSPLAFAVAQNLPNVMQTGDDMPGPMQVGDGMTEPSLIGQEINAPMPMPTSVPEPVTTPTPVTTPAPVTPPEPVTPPASTTVASNQPTETTAPANVSNQNPFASSVRQVASGLDPLTEQLLFGVGGQGGFIPGAMRAAEKTFYDDEGNPIVIDEKVAGFSPDQMAAMQMQREAVGLQDPYLQQAAGAYGAGTQALEEGLQRGRTAALGSLAATTGGVGSLQAGLGESADILRGTMGGYDPSMTSRFYDPFEDRVVQQTIQDVMEQGAKADIGALAGDIARGGQSAFGSRARLGAAERQEALGKGLSEALSGIRSRGFTEAQRTGLGEFARQKAAERAVSGGLAGLAGQGFGGSQALAGALSGLGQTEQNIGQQRFKGQFGLGSSLQGLGAQAAGASASDIAALYGMGTQQQGQAQQMLDAQRRNLQQRQMTPLLQYQALQPFVSMAPAGQFQTITDFTPRPSAMMTGIGTGLQAFGSLGNLYGGK